jgi:hypothetical protein
MSQSSSNQRRTLRMREKDKRGEEYIDKSEETDSDT